MQIHSLKDLAPCRGLTLLEQGMSLVEPSPDFDNYHPSSLDNPANIFYLLGHGRFTVGNYFVLEENEKYAGSAGWNKYNETVALCFVRAYIPKENRNRFLLSNMILPLIFEQAKNFKSLWITCNQHNKIIYDGLERIDKNSNSLWPEVYANFKPIGQIMVNNVSQYVAEFKLNRNMI